MSNERGENMDSRSTEDQAAGRTPPPGHMPPPGPENFHRPPAGPPLYCYPPPPPPPPRRSRFGTIVLTILLVGSVLLNLLLMMTVAGLVVRGPSREEPLREVVVADAATESRIALLHINGIITEELSGGATAIGADYEYVKLQVERILNNQNVKAVVVRVNSPGGGASASDMMLNQLKRLRDERRLPVVVHMGSLAASGGYYVAMAGDHIMAQPTTLTGSIGVIAQFFSVENLLGEKLGVNSYIIESGQRKSMGSPLRNMTDEEQQYMHETIVMPMYERFIAVIAEGRPDLPEAELREVADGRVLNAQQALDAGLVDEIGFQEDAVRLAMRLAHIERAKLVQYERQVGLFDVLGLASSAKSADLRVSPETIGRLTQPRVLMQWQP